MRSFLLSSFTRRISICGLIATLVILSAYGLLIFSSLEDWRLDSDKRKQWMEESNVRCGNLFSKLQAEIEAIDSGRCPDERRTVSEIYCESRKAQRRKELIVQHLFCKNLQGWSLGWVNQGFIFK